MPVFRSHGVAEIARGLRAFLRVEAGVSRGPVPESPERRNGQEERLRRRLAEKDARIVRLEKEANSKNPSVNPANLVWIFGYQRSGSTWLSAMLGNLEGHRVWEEPCVGDLFGSFYYLRARERQLKAGEFILGSDRAAWLGLVRSFVLGAAGVYFGPLEKDEVLVVKEPHGSIGAPILSEALPESRVMLLVRDPRDAIASALDGYRKNGWAYERTHEDPRRGANYGRADAEDANQDPNLFVGRRAEDWLRNVGKAVEAYDGHRGPKALVRYEDLVSDAEGALRRICGELGLPTAEVRRVVQKHAWSGVPEEQRGVGKFYRKGTFGGWREDLTPEQARSIEETTAPLLERFYPE